MRHFMNLGFYKVISGESYLLETDEKLKDKTVRFVALYATGPRSQSSLLLSPKYRMVPERRKRRDGGAVKLDASTVYWL